MTEKTYHSGPRGLEKAPGWFSWRHQTREVHDASVARRNASRGPWARRRKAEERQAILDTLTPEQRGQKFRAEKARYDQARR
jgi:hypothetical protein